MERGGEGKGRWGKPPALLPPTGFCLKYHPDNNFRNTEEIAPILIFVVDVLVSIRDLHRQKKRYIAI